MCRSYLVHDCFRVVGMCIVSCEGRRPVLVTLILFMERLASLHLGSQNTSQWYSKVMYRLMWLQRLWQLANFPKCWTIPSNSLILTMSLLLLKRRLLSFHKFVPEQSGAQLLLKPLNHPLHPPLHSLFRFFIHISARYANLLYPSLTSVCLKSFFFF